MNMKKRVERMTTDAVARREAAWEPLIDCIRSEPFPDDAFALMRRWRQFPEQTKEAGWAQLPPVWGTEDEVSAWERWWAAFDAALEKKGMGAWPYVGPGQVPLPPEEPPGLWERLCTLAADDDPAGCAAAYALLWLAIARSLRRENEPARGSA